MPRLPNNTPAKRLSAAMPEDISGLGPAMQALTPRQRGFVDALFVLGSGGDGVQAATMAGYEGDRNTLGSTAYKLTHNEKVQAAIREEANRRVVGTLPVMTAKLAAIACNDEHRNQLEAVKHSMAIAGVSPKIQHEVVHKTDRASLVQEIAGSIALLKQLGAEINLTQLAEPVTIDVTPEKSE